MKKRFLALGMGALMLLPALCGVAACGGNKDSKTYNITVWVGEGTDTLTKQQIQRFNETNEDGVTFNASVRIVSESKAVGDASSKPQSCADIFCFAQDQLARAVYGKLLAPLNNGSVNAITSSCDERSVEGAKIGGTIRAFPLTYDNGYFMYYDKRVVKEEHIGSLEDILADIDAYKGEGGLPRNFSMNLTDDGGSWYSASFFYATGCESEWTTDDEGNFIDYSDTFKSENGLIALKGIQKVLKFSKYHASAEVSDFKAGIPSAVVVSGIWGYNAAKNALGDNLGIAPLPSFWVDANGNGQKDEGESYQLKTYLGSKFMGIKPQSDLYRVAYLQKLAQFLTNEQCQKERYEAVGWGPSNKAAAASASSPALNALKESATTPQGQYPTGWWAKLDVMVGNAKTSAGDDASLNALLTTYSNALNELKKS